MPETRRRKRAGEWSGGVSSMVQVKDAMNYSFRQEFKPSIKNGVSWDIYRDKTGTAGEQVCNEMAFQKWDVRTRSIVTEGQG